MSWAEVKKINSNLKEPLNYAGYIADIASFGGNSAILQPYNNSVWEDFFMKSTELYCQRNAHDYVYNRLTDANLDRLWTEHKSLGKLLNAFFNVSFFADGDAAKVVAGMTQKAYNSLPDKFRRGYQRYVAENMNKNTNVGLWLNEIFTLNSAILAEKATWTEILDSPDSIKVISASEAAFVAVTTNIDTTNLLIKHASALSIIVQNITQLESELLWFVITTNTTLLTAIYNNSEIMTVVANSNLIFESILRDANALSHLISNTNAMKIAFDTANSRNIITQTITEVSKSTDALVRIKGEISLINSQLPNVVGSGVPMESMTATSTQITASLSILNPIITAATAVENLMQSLINNSTSMYAMANSAPTMQILSGDIFASKMMAENQTAVRYISSSSVAMNAITKNEIAMTEFAKSTYARQQFSTSALPFYYVIKSDFRKLLFDYLDFRQYVNSYKNSLLSSTYFDAVERMYSCQLNVSWPVILVPYASDGEIYLPKKIVATDKYPLDPGGTNKLSIYNYTDDYKIQELTVTANGNTTNTYNLTTFATLYPICRLDSYTGTYPGEVVLTTTYTKYTAKQEV